MFKNKIDKYLRRTGYTEMKDSWTLDKSMASLSTCHFSFLPWMAVLLKILLNLVTDA